MFNEREFIARVEAADADELARLLEHPVPDQERALRAHLGDERYQRMHGLALKRSSVRSLARDAAARPNVVVIHGIMGAELSVSGVNGGSGDMTWVNYWRIMRGWLDRLRLTPDGRSEANDKFRVRASGIMKRYYGELILSLAQRNNVKDFFFDWRKDLNIAADGLNSKINEWFGSDPAHIVAHSMGGLAARTFIANYPARWASMWDTKENGRRGGRLVMLGTPNHGSYTIPTVMTGLEGTVRKLATLDLRHGADELLETLNTFVGSYQMLPSPRVVPEAEPLYQAATYSPFQVSQDHLDGARRFHERIAGAVDSRRMVYVAGYNRPTLSGVKDWRKLDRLEGYSITREGDGRVPHSLGRLESIKMYYVDEDHGALSTNRTVMRALDDLLATGETRVLSDTLPAVRAVQPRGEREVREELEKNLDKELAEITNSLSRMRVRTASRVAGDGETITVPAGDETAPDERYGPEQRRLEENVMLGFLGGGRGARSTVSARETFARRARGRAPAAIEIGLVLGGIEEVHKRQMRSDGGFTAPVDAVAVGHYVGVRPQAGEESLDVSISEALFRWEPSEENRKRKSELILTQFTDRGIIHGKLGEPFFMPDPRDRGGRNGSDDRIIALAGMGEPSSLGSPELTVLVRELCWSLGRLNKQHLATVLIGSGNGNLEVREAVAAWVEGIRRALTGSIYDEGWRLDRITFVEFDPRKIREIEDALKAETNWQGEVADSGRRAGSRKNDGAKTEQLSIRYVPLSRAELDEVQARIEGREREGWQRAKRQGEAPKGKPPAPTRVNLSLDATKKTYTFGAITDTASVPERGIRIDPRLIMRANDEMVGETAGAMQLERGRFLEGLLMPDDLRRHLYSSAPLVLMLDATTARIHWEMVAQPEITNTPVSAATDAAGEVDEEVYKKGFLGTTRGLTRQLRTTFAPPPEPPPPPRRVLRVLVVADPAADAHLPGAQEEGVEVADLFDSYNLAYQGDDQSSRVQVKRMFGPFEATRTNVLRELMSRPYDVLHYAGHCVFRWDGDPEASGWIFSAKDRELLSAFELNRIDRVPKFVFSNACESGITPDRSEERSAALAPSFAEAFFNRGVSNFVCTAWPVDDLGARQFALTLYSRLLGLKAVEGQPGSYERDPLGARPMHVAMRDARREIAVTPNGRTTWGAYQHYGNPYFQFFYPKKEESDQVPRTSLGRAVGKAGGGAGKKRRGAKKSAAKASKKDGRQR